MCLLSHCLGLVYCLSAAVAFVSLAWTVIISVMRGALEEDAPATATATAPTSQELSQQQHAAVAATAAAAVTAVAAAAGGGGSGAGHAVHAPSASLSQVVKEGGAGLKGLVATPSVAEAQT
jgi:hypothetical protein